MNKQVKVIATLGPSTSSTAIWDKLIENGVNIFRLNLKHNEVKWHQKIIDNLKSKNVLTMVDLPSVDSSIEVKNFDILALSHVKTAKDIEKKKHKNITVVAKIEEERAIDNIEEIIEAADGVMIARGDLGRNTPIEKLGIFQKQIIDLARTKQKAVIVATEMLLSMTKNKIPSRAEANDVANAVFDGTDALMLSEETAVGDYPDLAVSTMSRIADYSEKFGKIKSVEFLPITASDHILAAGREMLNDSELRIKKVIVYSKSGRSARILSSFRCHQPILAVVDDEKIFNQLSLGFGLIPYLIKKEEEMVEKLVEKGDRILLIHGNNWLQTGSINSLSIRDF